MSRTHRATLAGSVLVGSLLFVAGGATAAHAEMTDPPIAADVDSPIGNGTWWNPGTPAGGTPWVAGDYQFSMTNYAGYDFWARKDGSAPAPTDAGNLASNMNYGGGCVVPWWTERVMCHD